MSLHKLTAGHGYDYLTRQVAAMDSTEKGHLGLASYYTAKGETPGVWIGRGLDGLDGLSVGDAVTAEQMRALFGSGHHPLADQRAAVLGESATTKELREAVRLGSPFHIYEHDISPFQVEVAKRLAKLNTDAGSLSRAPHEAAVRARIRTQVGHEMFRGEFGRAPLNERELAGFIAKMSRQQTTAVAGFDHTFSPVKSVSALWALADQPTAALIERAHQLAVADGLRFIEDNALFTRSGRQGVQQVNVRGLVATAFTHRDSRAGDPDLHTHVAVANKVQTLDGRWLSIDGRVLYKAIVAASETYNTALEGHLARLLGVRFADRPGTDAGKRPIREVVGVSGALLERWSQRRASINVRRGELATDFQRDHGRPPTMVESLALAQQATLETREAKHEPRSLAEQRVAWRAEAQQVLGPAGIAGMLHTALTQAPARIGEQLSQAWIEASARDLIATLEGSRSVWQRWHVEAEAQRQARAESLPLPFAREAVKRIVAAALEQHSVALTKPTHRVAEPEVLRRTDGASVYTVAGAQLFTSARIVAAEQRLLVAAGLAGGRMVSDTAVDVALLEAVANQVELNVGQVALVRQMAQSGARVQLAIAPAGSGKTTAMRALATAWSHGGGNIIGLAPSAAAASGLGEQIGHRADTLAKLVHSINVGDLPDWAETIGPQSLVVIDEAGMADTLSLDTVVEFVIDRGGSVRLVGDDQQLAAIGAGGVLRDIRSHHGALELNDLLRFADPAEGAAGLALRDGRIEAIGFYLDRGRVHVGDLDTITHALFNAWLTDRHAGLDALMLAPTRALVAELNSRARQHRLEGHRPEREVQLADGSHASIGDTIITRTNRRDLRLSATDWVKNGDRWTIAGVGDKGALTVQHNESRRIVTLPASYVAESVDLGYACTIHAAQGVTVDAMHGVDDGSITRQQLYTMMSRARLHNHIYMVVVGDGDPHNMVRPEAVRPPTATDLLINTLARDAAATSATTAMNDLAAPAALVADHAARYADALGVAAKDFLGSDQLTALEHHAAAVDGRIVTAEAWPALLNHLALIATSGANPAKALSAAYAEREVGSAADVAAVLHWRINALHRLPAGPLPWLPGIPDALTHHPTWGPYLADTALQTRQAAEQVRIEAVTEPVPWLLPGMPRPDDATIAEIAVWRAVFRVPDSDLRPTGPPQLSAAEATYQRRLTVAGERHLHEVIQRWRTPINTAIGHRALNPDGAHPGNRDAFSSDPFAPMLAYRLSQIASTGLDAAGLLRAAGNEGALPDDLPAAALWWRICRHISPTVARDANNTSATHHDYPAELTAMLGAERSTALQASPLWPILVAALYAARAEGWAVHDLISTQPAPDGTDEAQAWVWRISVLLDPIPTSEPEPHEYSVAEDDLAEQTPPAEYPGDDAGADDPPPLSEHLPPDPHDWIAEANPFAQDVDNEAPVLEELTDDESAATSLVLEAGLRRVLPLPELSDADLAIHMARADAWNGLPHTPQRLAQVNQMAANYYASCYPSSWAQHYLQGRFGVDPSSRPGLVVGYAPAGWTHLVDHLRRRGVTDAELLAAGLATTARTGRLIDRFRDRVTFAISHDGDIVGFAGRRHPDRGDLDNAGPKYLNTAQTPLFHKGAQLYVADPSLIGAGATPVLVEGPADAVAVSIAGEGRYVGVASMGTSLTTEQAQQLHQCGHSVVVATDNDIAGQVAAQRDYWILSAHQVPALHAALPAGTDPADLLATRRSDQLLNALDDAASLCQVLIDERVANLPLSDAILDAAAIIAALPADDWEPAITRLEQATSAPADTIRLAVKPLAAAWNNNAVASADRQLRTSTALRARLESAAIGTKWQTLAARIDSALLTDRGWPSLAHAMEALDRTGLDVSQVAAIAMEEGSLAPRRQAQDLTDRLNQFHSEPAESVQPPPGRHVEAGPTGPLPTPGVDR